jgi:CRISPR-associated protein Csx3
MTSFSSPATGSPPDPRTGYHGAVIAVGGPPHSGKSVFLAELYRQLLQRQPSGVFLQRACPDGEGMWSNEADLGCVIN